MTQPLARQGAPNISVDTLTTRLQRRMRTPLRVPGFRSAAVLVPLLHTEQGWQVLFTVRARHLRHHPGQIAFPGGKLEPHEPVQNAALRECAEEVGLTLPPHCVLGLLDDQLSPSGFVVTPVVAACHITEHRLASLALQPSEVDDAFIVSLAELTALAPRQEARSVRGFTRILHDYRWQQRRIWGLTGNVLADMLEVLNTDSLVDVRSGFACAPLEPHHSNSQAPNSQNLNKSNPDKSDLDTPRSARSLPDRSLP